MKLTMKDIAKATGVSQPTISRILNGSSNVKSEKKIKVLEYIEKVGYRPNLVAKSLKNNSSYLIGVCVPEMTNPYYIEVIEVLEKIGRKNNYSLIIHNSQKNPVLEWECIMDFVDRQVDGIALIPCSNFNMDKLADTKIPSVILTIMKKGIDSIGVNHISGGMIAGKHLLNLGHQNIGYIGGNVKNDEKFIGFRRELSENGVEFSMDNHVCISDYSNTEKEKEEVIREFCQKRLDSLPTAFFTGNDIVAYELIKILDDFGLNVPEDVSVIGFDDTIIARALKITSIKQPIEDISTLGFEMLIKKIENKNNSKIDTHCEQIELEPILFKRKTTIKNKKI